MSSLTDIEVKQIVNGRTRGPDPLATELMLKGVCHSWTLSCDDIHPPGWMGPHGEGSPRKTHLVDKTRPDGFWNALLQVGVLKDDSRILAPQLQRELLAVGSTQLGNALGCGLAPGEGDHGHLWVGH